MLVIMVYKDTLTPSPRVLFCSCCYHWFVNTNEKICTVAMVTCWLTLSQNPDITSGLSFVLWAAEGQNSSALPRHRFTSSSIEWCYVNSVFRFISADMEYVKSRSSVHQRDAQPGYRAVWTREEGEQDSSRHQLIHTTTHCEATRKRPTSVDSHPGEVTWEPQ